MFSQLPLLRCIAVNPQYRNIGIGKEMLSYYEVIGFGKSNKLFLCVSDFNRKAKTLYNLIGYKVVASLYIDDVTEHIMMNSKHLGKK